MQREQIRNEAKFFITRKDGVTRALRMNDPRIDPENPLQTAINLAGSHEVDVAMVASVAAAPRRKEARALFRNSAPRLLRKAYALRNERPAFGSVDSDGYSVPDDVRRKARRAAGIGRSR